MPLFERQIINLKEVGVDEMVNRLFTWKIDDLVKSIIWSK